MLDLHRLRLLREVAGRGTVHAAARALGYTPSAISQQLVVLEREAGAPLLERVGRNVRLTEAGTVLVRHAASLLAGVEAAEAELAAVAAGRAAGVVRVGAFQSAFLGIVVPAIRSLTASHPDIRVTATEIEVEAGAPALRLQQLDAVVGDEYSGQPRAVHADLFREPLLREEIRLVLPAGHPAAATRRVRLAGLAALSWSASQPGTGHREMQLRTCRELGGFEPDLRYSSDDFFTQLELVRAAGAGALLPELGLAQSTADVAVRSLADGDVGREVFLLTRAARTPAVAAVATALRQAAAGQRRPPGAGTRRTGPVAAAISS